MAFHVVRTVEPNERPYLILKLDKHCPGLFYKCIWSQICSCFAGSKWIWAREQRWESIPFVNLSVSLWYSDGALSLCACDRWSVTHICWGMLLINGCWSSALVLECSFSVNGTETHIPWFHVCWPPLQSGLLIKDSWSNTDSGFQMTVGLAGQNEGIPLEIQHV